MTWMKGAVLSLLRPLHAGKVEFEPADFAAFERGASLAVKLNGRRIGILGALSGRRRHPYRLTTQMVLCELELAPLLKRFDAAGKVAPPPQFPSVRRDVAVVAADSSVTCGMLEDAIRKSGAANLEKIELFDVFRPKGAAKGARSLAYALEFRSPSKTLTDDEVGQSFAKAVAALKSIGGVEVREG